MKSNNFTLNQAMPTMQGILVGNHSQTACDVKIDEKLAMWLFNMLINYYTPTPHIHGPYLLREFAQN